MQSFQQLFVILKDYREKKKGGCGILIKKERKVIYFKNFKKSMNFIRSQLVFFFFQIIDHKRKSEGLTLHHYIKKKKNYFIILKKKNERKNILKLMRIKNKYLEE